MPESGHVVDQSHACPYLLSLLPITRAWSSFPFSPSNWTINHKYPTTCMEPAYFFSSQPNSLQLALDGPLPHHVCRPCPDIKTYICQRLLQVSVGHALRPTPMHDHKQTHVLSKICPFGAGKGAAPSHSMFALTMCPMGGRISFVMSVFNAYFLGYIPVPKSIISYPWSTYSCLQCIASIFTCFTKFVAHFLFLFIFISFLLFMWSW